MSKKLLLLISTFICGGIAVNSLAHEPKNLEPLYGIAFGAESIDILVISNGCTTPEDFKLTSHKINDEQLVGITRIKKDRCRAMPKVINVTLNMKLEDKNDPQKYQIRNKFLKLN